MIFKFKPKIGIWKPCELNDTEWGIMNRSSGELLRKNNRIERYPKQWAINRCKELNNQED